MKRFLIGALALVAASLLSGPALAQGNDCSGGAISGMVVGGTTGACYYLKPNSDGSLNIGGGVSPTPALVTITDRSRSLSTSSATVAAANTSRTTLTLQNLDTSINECYSFTGAAVCGAAGTYTLYPGQTAFWPAGSAPRLAVTAISASGTPVISAYEGQ